MISTSLEVDLFNSDEFFVYLKLESRVDGHHTKSEILIAAHLEASGLHSADQLVLTRELANGFDQVLVGGAILGHQLTHGRDDIEGVKIVELTNERVVDVTELEAHEATA